MGQKRKDGLGKGRGSKTSQGEEKGDNQTLNGLSRRTGLSSRRHKCDRGFHLEPKCPWRDVPESESGLASPDQGKARNPTSPTISTGTPVSTKRQIASAARPMRTPRMWVGYSWSRRRILWWFRKRVPRPISRASVRSSAATAFCFGEDTNRLQHIRLLRASDLGMVAVATCSTQRMFQWVSREASVKSLLSRWMLNSSFVAQGRLETLGRRLDPPRDISTLLKRGFGYPRASDPEGTVNPECGRFWGRPVEEADGSHGLCIVFRLGSYEQIPECTQWRLTPALRGGWPVPVWAPTNFSGL